MRSTIPFIGFDGFDRQDALRDRYAREPQRAWTTNLAWTEVATGADPYRGAVQAGLAGPALRYAVDEALGGAHDDIVPGELLCAALAACVDSTIRILAARTRVRLERLAVIATADLDARGALGAGGAPVGVQSMRLEIHVAVAAGLQAMAAELLAAAERRSLVLETLRVAVPIIIVHEIG